MAVCEQCGREFQARRVTARFCGGTCRQAWNRANAKPDTGPMSQAFRLRDNLYSLLEGMADELKGTRSWAKGQVATIQAADKIILLLRAEVEEEAAKAQAKVEEEAAKAQAKVESAEEDAAFWKGQMDFWQGQADTYRNWWRERTDQLSALRESSSNSDGGLTEEEWAKLRKMTDTQLRQWVRAGQAMDRKGHDSPMGNALRWIDGNIPTLPETENGEALQDNL